MALIIHTAAFWLQKGLVAVDRNALSYLNEVNQSMDEVFAMLDKLAEYPELQREDFIILGAHFREHLSNANMTVLSLWKNPSRKK